LEDSNDYAGCSRDTKFKPLVLDEIHAADDNVIQFFHRSTKRGEQSQPEYQKMYDDGIQIALKYFGQ